MCPQYGRIVLPGEQFERLVAEQAASDHAWAQGARRWGMLTVFNQLWELSMLSPSGEVHVDRGAGALSPATPAEREVAHTQAARRHPELRHLMPERPPSARECPVCAGSGESITSDGRRLFCGEPCNTKGWISRP